MPFYDTFIIAMKIDLRSKGLTYDDAAEAASMSKRQFARYVRGETKQGMMPPEIVRDLRRKGAIDEATAGIYGEGLKEYIVKLKRDKRSRLMKL